MLIEVQSIKDILKLVLQTAYIKHKITPVNLILIAKPESAKTAAMNIFKIPDTYTTNNLTQAVIVSKFLPMIESGKLKYLIIPDFINAVEKDRRTAKATVNLLKTLIEEGITSLDQFNVRTTRVYEPPIRCGLITGITTESYHGIYNPQTERTEGGIKHYWKRIGMLSRFIPFSYQYELAKIVKVFKHIEEEEREITGKKEKIKRTTTEIKGNPQLFQQLELISTKVGAQAGGYGFRMQRSLQYLAKANAKLNNREEVTQEDIDKLLKLSNWINYEFNPL